MKRVLTIATALAMLVSLMTVAASAAYSDSGTHITKDTVGNTGKYGESSTSYSAGATIGTGTVPVKFNNGVDGGITNVYAVSFTPSELEFTYGGGAQYIWNPENLEYEMVSAGGESWTPVTNTITITNYSDLPVEIEASFSKDARITETVTAAFTDTDAASTTDDGKLSLASAVTTNNLGEKGTPTTGSFTVAFTGKLDTLYPNGTALGTITLTLKVPNA